MVRAPVWNQTVLRDGMVFRPNLLLGGDGVARGVALATALGAHVVSTGNLAQTRGERGMLLCVAFGWWDIFSPF